MKAVPAGSLFLLSDILKWTHSVFVPEVISIHIDLPQIELNVGEPTCPLEITRYIYGRGS